MADEIIGHDNLDHGRHMRQSGKHHFEPGERLSRGNRPQHVGLRKPRLIREEHRELHLHPEDSEGGTHAHSNLERNSYNSNTYNAKEKFSSAKSFQQRKKYLTTLLVVAVALPVVLFLSSSFPGFTALAIILAINTAVEFHKHFTTGMPLDFEILFFGVAYLTIVHGAFLGLVAALCGPLLAATARGHVCSAVIRKSLALLVTLLAALVLSASSAEILFAIILGIGAFYAIIIASGKNSGINTAIARFTTLGINAYLALFFLPMIL